MVLAEIYSILDKLLLVQSPTLDFLPVKRKISDFSDLNDLLEGKSKLKPKAFFKEKSNQEKFLIFVKLIELSQSINTNTKKERFKKVVQALGKTKVLKSPAFKFKDIEQAGQSITNVESLYNFIETYGRNFYNPLSLHQTYQKFYITPKLFGSLDVRRVGDRN